MRPTRANRPTVAVCGSSAPEPETEKMAEVLGEEVMSSGMDLVCGGMGGVMEAVCKGAASARAAGRGDGLIIGILPGADKGSANPYCDVVLPTGMGIARNLLVVRAADAVVLVQGGSGTLSEAAFAWQLGLPVVALSPSGGWAARLAGETLDSRRSGTVLAARNPAEAVAMVRDALNRKGPAGVRT